MTKVQGLNGNGEELRDVYVEHRDYDLFCPPEEGMTRQEFADECDINVLMAQYEKNGVMPPLARGEPQYLDVSDVPNLQRAHEMLRDAERAFMTLSASVRKEFDNDPVRFVEFAQDPANLDKMREWGLAPPKPAPASPVAASGGATADAPASGGVSAAS